MTFQQEYLMFILIFIMFIFTIAVYMMKKLDLIDYDDNYEIINNNINDDFNIDVIKKNNFQELKIFNHYKVKFIKGKYPQIIYPIYNMDIVECSEEFFKDKEHAKDFKNRVMVATEVVVKQHQVFINKKPFSYDLNNFKRIATKDIDEVKSGDICICIIDIPKSNIKVGDTFKIIRVSEDNIYFYDYYGDKIYEKIKNFKYLRDIYYKDNDYVSMPKLNQDDIVLISNPSYYNHFDEDTFYFSHFGKNNNIYCYEELNKKDKLTMFKEFKIFEQESEISKISKKYEEINKNIIDKRILEEYKKEKKKLEKKHILTREELVDKWSHLDFDKVGKEIINVKEHFIDKFLDETMYNKVILIHMEKYLDTLNDEDIRKYQLLLNDILEEKKYCFLKLNNIIILTDITILNKLEEHLKSNKNNFKLAIKLFEEEISNIKTKDY